MIDQPVISVKPQAKRQYIASHKRVWNDCIAAVVPSLLRSILLSPELFHNRARRTKMRKCGA